MASQYISVSPLVVSTPGFSFGRSGDVNSGSYLQIDGVTSNKAGRIVPFIESRLAHVFVSCENDATFTLEVQTRAGNIFTTVYTITVTNTRKFAEEILDVDVPFLFGDEISIKVGSGSCRNVVVGLLLKGI